MIYLDNAATSFKKPPEVSRAVYNAMVNFGANAGRGGHKLSARAGEEVYKARELLGELFGIDDIERIAFFPNTTYALNAAISGSVKSKDHVITTSMEHNSVARPLAELEKKGRASYSIVRGNKYGRISEDAIKKAFRPNTRLVVICAASNVCGNVYDIERIAEIAHKNGALILIDAAQLAGMGEIDAKKFDMVAFPGHKGLMGPQGTGGLYVARSVTLSPFASGGTGSMSESLYQPEEMPDRLESGTLNMPGIAGLSEGIKFIMREGIKNIHEHEMALFEYAKNALLNMDNITLYGDLNGNRVGVLSFNIDGIDSVSAANELSERYDICVRGGLHCAPLAHKTLGTVQGGTVRMSFGYFNTLKEVRRAVEAVYKMSKNR